MTAFEEEFLRLEREEKRQRLLEQAVNMRPIRMRTLESITGSTQRTGSKKWLNYHLR